MKLLKREYLNTLIEVMGTPDIKVITGVRRSGKSKLLELFKEYIINNVKNYNIIDINYNSLDFENLKEYHKLNDYVEQRYKKGMNNFVLIDEVQMCEGFEKTINSLHAEEKFDIYNTLIVRDIFERNKIKDEKLMSSINDFLMDNISNRTSLRNVSNSLNNCNLETNHKTVGNYIEYLCEAFAFYKISRYDIKGKKYLNSDEKYYLSDHAFRYARLGTKSLDYGRVYENIVAIELLRRGYEVYTGILYNKEVDFIALKRNEKIYIQVSDNIDYEDTLKREVEPLLQIKDAYPKMIIARTKHEDYQYEGIQICDIANWLLK